MSTLKLMLLFTFCPIILELRHWVPSPILGLGRLFWFSLASSSSLLEREKVVNAKKINVVKDTTYAAVPPPPPPRLTGSQSMISGIWVQHYNYWASKPTGNWSFTIFIGISAQPGISAHAPQISTLPWISAHSQGPKI